MFVQAVRMPGGLDFYTCGHRSDMNTIKLHEFNGWVTTLGNTVYYISDVQSFNNLKCNIFV